MGGPLAVLALTHESVHVSVCLYEHSSEQHPHPTTRQHGSGHISPPLPSRQRTGEVRCLPHVNKYLHTFTASSLVRENHHILRRHDSLCAFPVKQEFNEDQYLPSSFKTKSHLAIASRISAQFSAPGYNTLEIAGNALCNLAEINATAQPHASRDLFHAHGMQSEQSFHMKTFRGATCDCEHTVQDKKPQNPLPTHL